MVAGRLEADAASPAREIEAELRAELGRLVGRPFSQLGFSYGDELQLDFGELRPIRHRLLSDMLEGEYILGSRNSRWQFRLAGGKTLIESDPDPKLVASGFLKAVSKQELTDAPPITLGSRVVKASPFVDKHLNGWGLELRFSDGSELLLLPTPHGPPIFTPEGELIPDVADWELFLPDDVLLSAWRGPKWTLELPDQKPATEKAIAGAPAA